jgi:hypothetical protein
MESIERFFHAVVELIRRIIFIFNCIFGVALLAVIVAVVVICMPKFKTDTSEHVARYQHIAPHNDNPDQSTVADSSSAIADADPITADPITAEPAVPHSAINIKNAREIIADKPFHIASLSRSGIYTIVVFSMNGCPPCDMVWDHIKDSIKGNSKICAVKVNISPLLNRLKFKSSSNAIEDEAFYSSIWHADNVGGFPSLVAFNPVGMQITETDAGGQSPLYKRDGLFNGEDECDSMIATVVKHSENIPRVLHLDTGTREMLLKLRMQKARGINQ